MSDTLPLEHDAFVSAIESYLRNEADIAVLERQGAILRLRVGRSVMTVNLGNLYQMYTRHPAPLATVTTTLIQTLRRHHDTRSITSFAELRERVYPMLKPIAILAQVHEQNLPMIAYRPFLADLIIAYVIDEPGSVAYINEGHLARWRIREPDLYAQAMENLRRRITAHPAHTAVGEGAQRLIIFNTYDGFDATRLLLPDFLAQWRTEFPGNMVIGVPNRDFLILFSDHDEALFTSIAHQIQRDAAEQPYGLTDQLFTIEDGQVREYRWE